jgi:hypothetical protein
LSEFWLAFPRRSDRTPDAALVQLADSLDWFFEDASVIFASMWYLRGKRKLNRFGRRWFASVWLFLKSDSEDLRTKEVVCRKAITDEKLSFDLTFRNHRPGRFREAMAARKLGAQRRAWPFASVTEFELARSRRILLCG